MRGTTRVPAAWDQDWVRGDPPAGVPVDPDAPQPATSAQIASLAPRLREVLHAFLAGDSEKAAAERLGLSPHTIHEYAKRLYRAFGVSSRPELLARFVVVPADEPDRNGMRHSGGNGNGNATGNGHSRSSRNGNVHSHTNGNGNGNGRSLVSGNGQDIPSASEAATPAIVPAGLSPDQAQHVDYCVQLLRKRGFMVRMAEAAEDLVNRRRGFVAAAVLLLVLGVMTTVSLMDSGVERPSQLRPAAAPVPLLPSSEYPRRMTIGVPANGEWIEAGRAELWEVLEWQTDPPGEPALLRIDARELAPGVRHHIRAPGKVLVRSWGDEPRMLSIRIDSAPSESAGTGPAE